MSFIPQRFVIQPQTRLVLINILAQKLVYFDWKTNTIFRANTAGVEGAVKKWRDSEFLTERKTHVIFVFSFQRLYWEAKREPCWFPFAVDATTWPGKSTKKGEACTFLGITKHAWKRKAFKIMWNGQRRNLARRELQPGQEVEGAHVKWKNHRMVWVTDKHLIILK